MSKKKTFTIINSHPYMFLISVTIMLCSFALSVQAAPDSDKIVSLPGYPTDFPASVYAGYLKTSSDLRKLHYVFIQNYKGAKNTLPLTIWMNGGPGCASKIGLLQQIAPYLLPLNSDYQPEMSLTQNPFSWLNLTNLLFIDGPAGVGFSVNKDPNYKYNDKNTAQDSLDALIDFFTNKFPQYLINPLYIAGESYAGKYIPDLALLIDNYNALAKDENKMNLKGILLGNPAMNFRQGSMQDSQIQFMNTHHFIDPKIYPTWKGACHTDPESASCQFFYARYEQLMKKIDPYNIYGPCLDGKKHVSQSLFIKQLAKKYSKIKLGNDWPFVSPGFEECFNDKPIQDYFTINAKTFNSEVTNFKVCNESIYQNYEISEGGSMSQLSSLIGLNQIKVYFFSGDWDDVCPFTDTLKNLDRIGLKQDGIQTPLKIDKRHIGFVRSYQNKKLTKFFLLKGAGHEAVAYKPQTAYQIFQTFLAA